MSSAADPLASSGYKSLISGSPASTGGSGGFGSGNSGTQPLPGDKDSLTAFLNSLQNLTGTTGANLTQAGGTTTNTGLNVVGTGLQNSQTGMETLGTSLKTLQAPQDFYTKLLSGDPATMTQALAPTASLISGQYEAAKTGVGQGAPAGGYRSTALAGLPFAQASKVGDAALGLQTTAAQGLEQIASQQAGVGGQQGGLGVSQGGLGLGVAGVGSTETSQGLQALSTAIQGALSKMGINIQGGFANQFSSIAQGINALI